MCVYLFGVTALCDPQAAWSLHISNYLSHACCSCMVSIAGRTDRLADWQKTHGMLFTLTEMETKISVNGKWFLRKRKRKRQFEDGDKLREGLYRVLQEGQHPLTGQRAANFRLLANQWSERRLVTQWCHGCRAMRRSMCATQVLPMRVGPFAFRYQGNWAIPCQYIDTTGKAIDCATTLLLTVFI